MTTTPTPADGRPGTARPELREIAGRRPQLLRDCVIEPIAAP